MRNLANSMTLGAVLAKRSTAIETTKESWCEAEVNRIAGEIALKSPERNGESAKPISSALSPSPANNKPNPGNSAPP